MYWAIKNKNSLLISLLIKYGAKPSRTDGKGLTALDFALELGHEECILALIGSHESISYNVSILSASIISKLREQAQHVFKKIINQSISPLNIPQKIKEFQNLFFKILSNHKNLLEEWSSKQISLTNKYDEAQLIMMIKNLNRIVNPPQRSQNPICLIIMLDDPNWNRNTSCGRDMEYYLSCHKKIYFYIEHLKFLLKNFELTHPKTMESKLGFFDQISTTIKPNPDLEQLFKMIAKLQACSTEDKALDALSSIFQLISSNTKQKPQYVRDTFALVLNTLNNIAFDETHSKQLSATYTTSIPTQMFFTEHYLPPHIILETTQPNLLPRVPQFRENLRLFNTANSTVFNLKQTDILSFSRNEL